MRMVQWLLPVLVLSLAACDDTAGQPSEPTTPPRLSRITIQDVRALLGNPSPVTGFVQRNSVVDLLDTAAPQACSDTQPCVGQLPDRLHRAGLLVQQRLCPDPLRVPSTGVPLSVPVVPTRGDAGSGMAIRIVFDKLLGSAIEPSPPIRHSRRATRSRTRSRTASPSSTTRGQGDRDGEDLGQQRLAHLQLRHQSRRSVPPSCSSRRCRSRRRRRTPSSCRACPARRCEGRARRSAPTATALPASYSISFTTEVLTANPAARSPTSRRRRRRSRPTSSCNSRSGSRSTRRPRWSRSPVRRAR